MKVLMKFCLAVLPALVVTPFALAQVYDYGGQYADTMAVYGERMDSLEAAVTVSRQDGNVLSKGNEIRTEVISEAGLHKMACCVLAESFENSASVSVGYSDAITGARQIRLLGLSGIYTQMLDENRPIMRGIASPFGLSYVPGQWLESIQIAKGSPSVINGAESITGQINVEHRKPTDEKPLFLNASIMSDTKADFNVASCLQLDEKWSTAILGHVSGNFKSFDHNGDSYMDEPEQLQFNIANRWFYYADSGVQLRFGIRALHDSRKGGREEYDYDSYTEMLGGKNASDIPWGSDIKNSSLNGYLKVGIPLTPNNAQNLAFVTDYTFYNMDGYFGATKYLAKQNSAFLNALYQNEVRDSHKFTLGVSTIYDRYNEKFLRILTNSMEQGSGVPEIANLWDAGVFGEYTFHAGDAFTAIVGVRGDWYSQVNDGESRFKVSPRVTLKYSLGDVIILRANGGRGLRYANPLTDHIGVLSTGKVLQGDFSSHTLEDAWTFGGNITYYLPFGASDNTYLSFDYFRTQFVQQLVVDYEYGYLYERPNADDHATEIYFYNLDGRRSYSNNYQIDFNVEAFPRFTVTATFRLTSSKIQLKDTEWVEETPMTSRYKGVLNLQYATNLEKWIFDFTASVNGPCRVYKFMEDDMDADGNLLYKNGLTPVYPLLYFQVTKRFKGVDVYIGGENLTNYRQKQVVSGSRKDSNGYVSGNDLTFDASTVWGPIMGINVYAGVRFTLWKK